MKSKKTLSREEINLAESIEARNLRVQQGLFSTKPPFGYYFYRGKLQVETAQAEVVKQIFDEFLKGKSLRKIAREQNFSAMKVKRILENPVYIGNLRWKGEEIHGQHESIVAKPVFDEVQKRKGENK